MVASATSGTPTGSVQFLLNGGSVLGTAPLSGGSATFTAALPAGSQSVTAVYGGDGNFTMSTSAAVAVSVLVPDFDVAVSPSSLSIKQGQTGTATFTVTPVNGFNQPVSFTCGSLPSAVACSFSPSTVTPSGAPVSSTLSVSAAAPTLAGASAPAPPSETGSRIFVAAGLLLMPLALRRRRQKLSRLFALCAVLILPLLNGCGGGTPQQPVGGAPLGTSQVLVTVSSGVSSGSTQHTASFTITITN